MCVLQVGVGVKVENKVLSFHYQLKTNLMFGERTQNVGYTCLIICKYLNLEKIR